MTSDPLTASPSRIESCLSFHPTLIRSSLFSPCPLRLGDQAMPSDDRAMSSVET